jgi:hypothetical protein
MAGIEPGSAVLQSDAMSTAPRRQGQMSKKSLFLQKRATEPSAFGCPITISVEGKEDADPEMHQFRFSGMD